MKKIILVFLVATLSNNTSSFEHLEVNDNYEFSDNISVRRDIIGWRYKNINGRLYKRQYNYSKGIWLGKWSPM